MNVKVKKPFKSYRGDGKFVYVCYSLEDREIVFPIITRLNKERFRIRYDECVQDEVDALRKHNIRNCELFVAFISEKALLIPYFLEQIERAKEFGVNIFVVYLDDVAAESASKFFDGNVVKSANANGCAAEILHNILREQMSECYEPETVKEKVYTYDELIDEVYPDQENVGKDIFETTVQNDEEQIQEAASAASHSAKKAKLQKRQKRGSEFLNAVIVVGIMVIIALISWFFFGEQLSGFFHPEEVVNFAPCVNVSSVISAWLL